MVVRRGGDTLVFGCGNYVITTNSSKHRSLKVEIYAFGFRCSLDIRRLSYLYV
ncbi:Protein of unknown function [Pyronema omphalodes CBS 100304]|uniref:Uncharacterized protein n=1 Tax=Pyronema omphalodes (strain CBS 100304) TaxID=1076935 RepID=U4KTY0_PYROM|nr:Protein of unknown function [Pyronema omphalodes CBS 100304]